MEYVLLIVGAVLVNNLVLTRFLAVCPLLGVSKQVSTALGMSGAVIFVTTIAAMTTWAIEHFILEPLGLADYLQTVAFVLAIAVLVQLIDITLKRFMPSLHAGLGIFLPLMTTNCAVLGVTFINARAGDGFLMSALFGFAAALGFSLALVIFTGLRERIDRADPPRCFKGMAVSLITAGLLSLAFMGFDGLVK
jgi:electron transport complex protein RnfA